MSNKPRANQISLNTTSFSRNLSINDNDLQKAFNTIDQLTAGSGTSIHNSLLGIQGGSDADGYYHLTHTQYNGLLDGYNNGWSVLKGGTGITGYTSGDLLYASAANTLSKLPKSTDGYYLQLVGGLPSWKINTGSSLVLGRDLSNTINDAYVVGFNKISLDTTKEVGDGYAYLYSSLSSKFVPTEINNSYIITVGKHGLVTPNATNYLLSNFNESTDETTKAFLAPVAGTLSNLICYCNTAPGGSETVVITVRKNGIDTVITGTITGSGTTCSDIVNTINLDSGDRVTFKNVVSSGSIARDLFVSLIFTVPNINTSIVSGSGGGSTSFGTFASMPASASSGAIYVSSDSKASIWSYSGTAWRPIIKDTLCTKPPLASVFTKINDGGANHTLVDNKGTLNFTCPNDGAHTYNRGYIISYSNSTAYVEGGFPLNPYIDAANYSYFGIIMREAATGKSYSIGLRKEVSNFMNMQVFFRTSDSDESNYNIYQVTKNLNDIMFFRIIRSGSNIISQYSMDKQNWVQAETKVTTAVFTTAPDQIGITGWGYNAIATSPIYHIEYGSL